MAARMSCIKAIRGVNMSGQGWTPMLSAVEQTRREVSRAIAAKRKSQLGQFFTPARTARFMAGLFVQTPNSSCHLLDAGAGIGSLSAAFLERLASGGLDYQHITIDAFERDESLHPYLHKTLEEYGRRLDSVSHIRGGDFVETAVQSMCGSLFASALPRYTHALLNPPYKKIRSDSAHRRALRRAGIETVNLYSAFVSLSLALLVHRGQLVAIMPRSFCNGPYYRPFREFVLERAAIQHLHLFASRNTAFKDDGVLQENLIIRCERGAPQGEVTVTSSTDDSFADLQTDTYPFERIVFPDDRERFIHVPHSPRQSVLDESTAVRSSLSELGISVSTGPVVDFRLKRHLRDMPQEGTVPLLYPGHFKGYTTHWPKPDLKKSNAIVHNTNTHRWLYPNGWYCVVRRFSSKEEKRRIVASVVQPHRFPKAELLGFENHLNVFHERKGGLPESLARGLAVFLNTTVVDETFRRFNGHTQVNATDLRRMKYPSRATLVALGEWAMDCEELSQAEIDEQLANLAR